MPSLKDPRFQSDFSSNKGTLPWETAQMKPGAKDSVGSESNELKPFVGSADISKKGPFGGENKSS